MPGSMLRRRRRSGLGRFLAGALLAVTAVGVPVLASAPANAAGCSVSISRGQEWADRFNVNLTVSGTSAWTVSVALNGAQRLQNSWNATVTGTTGTLTARPNGAGNSFGITLFKNGSSALPGGSCTDGTGTGGGTGGGAGGGGSTGCSAGYVALTFDDGPNVSTTNTLVSTLRANGATATVFPIGANAAANPSLMQAYRNAGLQIGNHSWDHPDLTRLSQAQVQSQLSRAQTAVQQTAGVTPQLFRPPYGATNATVQSVASSLGMRQIIWDVDSTDWNGASAATIRSAAARLTNGQIILMHDAYATTQQALPLILSDLKARNLCTGKISPSTGRAVNPTTVS